MPADDVNEDPIVVLPASATVKAAADRFTGDVWVDGITNGAGPGTDDDSTGGRQWLR